MQPPPSLWLCGDTLVQLYSAEHHPNPGPPLWTWDAQTAPDLPDAARPWFQIMVESKPVDWHGQPHLLVASAWTGAVALLRRADRKIIFAAHAPEAHSADLLPGDWLAVAGSGPAGQFWLFHLEEGNLNAQPAYATPFPSAHGAVYDRQAQQVWTCGQDRLTAYQLTTPRPAWQETVSITLPDIDAHDLSPHPHTGDLIVSTHNAVWRITPSTRQLQPFAPLACIPNIKSVSINAITSQIAFTRGEAGHWWSENVYALTPQGHLQIRTLPARHLYKTRWHQPCQL